MSMFQHKTLGETVVSQATYVICRGCGCIVTDTGLCTYDCKYDATHHSRRPPESMIIRVWERTDKLVEEQEYTRTPVAKALAEPQEASGNFGTHIKEGIEIVKDWIDGKKNT